MACSVCVVGKPSQGGALQQLTFDFVTHEQEKHNVRLLNVIHLHSKGGNTDVSQ